MNKNKINKTASSVKEVLVAARWIIDNIGWCQNCEYKTKDGYLVIGCIDPGNVAAACLSGAISLIETTNDSLIHKTFEFVNRQVTKKYLGIVSWNDDPKRTKKQVLSFLDKLIKEA